MIFFSSIPILPSVPNCFTSNPTPQPLLLSSATASYRLLPHIKLLEPIPAHLAKKFQQCFAPGVITLEYDESTGENTKVVVANPRLDTVSREVLRHPEFKDIVQLSRIRDHFICECFSLLVSLFFSSLGFSRIPLGLRLALY